MVNIDGYAVVITNEQGKIIEVRDYHFGHPALCDHLGSTEIKDAIYAIETRDAEVLIPITYHYDAGGYRGGEYDDPSEELYVVNEFVLQREYKQKYKEEILSCWKHENERQYADDMIKDYEELYKEKLILQ